jgi:hypothetical protein
MDQDCQRQGKNSHVIIQRPDMCKAASKLDIHTHKFNPYDDAVTYFF